MKLLCSLFFLLISFAFANAQFAPVGSKWIHCYRSGSGAEQNSEMEIMKDTVIAAKKYSKIVHKSPGFSGEKIYLLRQNSRKVYFWQNASEHLYFDFNLKTGDSTLIDIPGQGPDSSNYYKRYVRIEKISSMDFVHGDSITIYEYSINSADSDSVKMFANGKIGDRWLLHSWPLDGDFLRLAQQYYILQEGGHSLNKFINIKHYFYKECVSTGIKENDNSTISFYPNPINGNSINITADHEIEIQIYDINGIEKFSKIIFPNSLIDISNFVPGIYILKYSDNSGQVKTEKLIKH